MTRADGQRKDRRASSTDDRRRYEELAQEMDELREENTCLRGLLGLEHRAASGDIRMVTNKSKGTR